jgi:hypothetical protein
MKRTEREKGTTFFEKNWFPRTFFYFRFNMEADWLASRMPGNLLDQRQPLPEEEEDSSEVMDFSVFADTGLDFEDLFNSEDLFGPDSAHYRAEDFSQLVTVQPDASNNNAKLLANQAASNNTVGQIVFNSNSNTGEAKSETEELAIETGTQQQQQKGEQRLAQQQHLCLQAQKNALPAVADEVSSFRKVKSPRDSAATTAQPRTDTLDGGGAVAPRSSAAAPGRISNSGGKRPVLPLIFPKPAAASVALVEAIRPVTTGHQFTPIAPAPPRYTYMDIGQPTQGEGKGGGS